MSLIDFYKNGDLKGKALAQIITFAGDGKLLDGNETSQDFRDLLGHIQLSEIRKYVEECLQTPAPKQFDGGLALQDIVNQIGKRLGFEVEDGRYRGSTTEAAYDGLWRLPDGRTIVVEVKTGTDFGADLKRVAQYRQRLIKDRPELSDETVSVLLVIGRGSTDGLEMQIRGSRYAWEMRIISIDALLQIADIKERIEAPTFQRLHEILIPKEFTRLDEITALVLSIAEDSSSEDDGSIQEVLDEDEKDKSSTKREGAKRERETPVSFRGAAVAKAENALLAQKEISSNLIPRSRTMFSTPDNTCGIVCSVSKLHQLPGGDQFWFVIHRSQKDFLDSVLRGWVAFGCGTEDMILLIPWLKFSPLLESLRMNLWEGAERWNISVVPHDSGKGLMLKTKSGKKNIEISEYLLDV